MRLVVILVVGYVALSSSVRAEEKADYFPLQVGNRWEYDISNPVRTVGTMSISVVDTTRISGISYFLLTGYQLGTVFQIYDPPDTLFVRKVGEKVFFRYFDGRDILFYDFAASDEESWHIPLSWNADYPTDGNVGFSIRINRDPERGYLIIPPEGHLFFGFQGYNIVDADWVEEFAQGIGPVASILYFAADGRQVTKLRRAVINHQEFDFDITVIEQHSWGGIKSEFLDKHPN